MKAAFLAAVAFLSIAAAPAKDERGAILSVIARMEAAWNRGDFRGYMAGFADPDVVFVSGGKIQDGWQGTLDHYIRDYGASEATRGRLHFYGMSVEMLGADSAMLIGHYHLERPQHANEGINTRLFRKRGGQWVIVMNHVSAYEVPPGDLAKLSAPPIASADRPDPPSN